jgi:hypothetical protein
MAGCESFESHVFSKHNQHQRPSNASYRDPADAALKTRDRLEFVAKGKLVLVRRAPKSGNPCATHMGALKNSGAPSGRRFTASLRDDAD